MAIAEVLCHEITDADIRKINAASNDAQTGVSASITYHVSTDSFLKRSHTKVEHHIESACSNIMTPAAREQRSAYDMLFSRRKRDRERCVSRR